MTGGRRLFLTVLAGARSCSKIALDGAPLRQSQPAPTKAKTFALGTRPRTSLLSCVPLASQELDATWARRNIFRRVTDEGEVDRGERFGIFRILWSGVRSSIRPWFAWHARAPAIFTRSPQLKCAEVNRAHDCCQRVSVAGVLRAGTRSSSSTRAAVGAPTAIDSSTWARRISTINIRAWCRSPFFPFRPHCHRRAVAEPSPLPRHLRRHHCSRRHRPTPCRTAHHRPLPPSAPVSSFLPN